MIVLAIKLHQFGFKVSSDIGKYSTPVLQHFPGEYAAPVCCDTHVREAQINWQHSSIAVPVSVENHDRAIALAGRYGMSFHHASIFTSALLAGCKTLYSEDLQHGQVNERQLLISNPFQRK